MDRGNHYEAAFEAYLQWHRLCYVAVDESRRSLVDDESIKSVDFIVFGGRGLGYLIDVKGRQFPAGPAGRRRRIWESWATRDDVEGLRRWERLFGAGYEGLLAFVYEVTAEGEAAVASEELWTWRDRYYVFRAVRVEEYRPRMRTRSPRWGTVDLPVRAFLEVSRPLDDFTCVRQPATEECPF
jgi:hypothetical protein